MMNWRLYPFFFFIIAFSIRTNDFPFSVFSMLLIYYRFVDESKHIQIDRSPIVKN